VACVLLFPKFVSGRDDFSLYICSAGVPTRAGDPDTRRGWGHPRYKWWAAWCF